MSLEDLKEKKISYTYDDLKKKIKDYSDEDKRLIEKAYLCADELHKGQFRQSGEPYIIHPVNVAYILADLYADSDTICAGLLHDVLEDTPIKKQELEEIFNKTIANLVGGVTKLERDVFATKNDQNLANKRKILTGMVNDVRIIVVKLADRLHNMRTLEFKRQEKQGENALETANLFVPLASIVGVYDIKRELEDLSLKYIDPDKYKEVAELQYKILEESQGYLDEMVENVRLLLHGNIESEISHQVKNKYGIYHRLEQGIKPTDMHDLLSLKIIVNEIIECYTAMGYVHSLYKPMEGKFKDHIANPKLHNSYQSLHTTVYGPGNILVQARLRTHEMEFISKYGLTGYWQLNAPDVSGNMRSYLESHGTFLKTLDTINKIYVDDSAFNKAVDAELLPNVQNSIYVSAIDGSLIELPRKSKPADFMYEIKPELINCVGKIIVNGKEVSMDYILQDGDHVKIITNKGNYSPISTNEAYTTCAKEYIKKLQETRK